MSILDISEDAYFSALLRLSFDISLDAISLLDIDGTILRMNDSALQAFGQLKPSNWIDLWDHQSHQSVREAFKRASGAMSAKLTSIQALGPSNDQTWETIIAPLVGAGGLAVRFLAKSRNVTSERNALLALKKSAEIHSALIDATSEIVWHFDVGSGITDRRGWQAFTGQPDNAFDADSWLQFLHPEDREQADFLTSQAFVERKPLLIEYRMRHHSGEWRWVEDHATPLLDNAGEISDWVGIISDIHDRRSAEEALRSSEERLRLAVEATGLACWEYEASTNRQVWSKEMLDMFQLPADCIASHATYLERVHPEDRARVDLEFMSVIACDEEFGASTFRIRVPSGEVRWIEGRSRIYRNEVGDIVRHIGTLQDITLRKQSEHEVWKAAYQDGLTGLANRRALNERMERDFFPKQRFKLLLIDLDRFKPVNDTYGHAVGDRLLIQVAERLRGVAGPEDFVARLGGDELALLVYGDLDKAKAMAARVIDAIARPFQIDGLAISVGCSIGMCCTDETRNTTELMQFSDLALYEAKRRGRGRSICYTSGMLDGVIERVQLEADMRMAIERGEMYLAYQPVLALTDDRIIGYEALIRWNHPTLGAIPPVRFIPLAEETGQIVPMGAWILREACQQAAQLPEDIYVAVNVSPVQFRSPLLLSHLTQALTQSGLAANRLEIELTETAIVEDGIQIAKTLTAIRRLGVTVAMDDFGTGYSSLAHLRDFPLDRIKLDRSFVATAETDPRSMAVLEGITHIARRLGVATLAEGVETSSQLQLMRDIGCDAIQGYLVGRPERLPQANQPKRLETRV